MVEHYNLYSDALDKMIKDDCCYAIQVDKLQDHKITLNFHSLCYPHSLQITNTRRTGITGICNTSKPLSRKLGIVTLVSSIM